MTSPLQKCYDEISVLKKELKKRDKQIDELIKINKTLNKNVERLLNKLPKRGKVAKIKDNFEKPIKELPKPIKEEPIIKPKRGKVAKIKDNFEKPIKELPKPIKEEPIIKPKRGKVAKIKDNFEKNIVEPIIKPKPSIRGKVAKIKDNFEKPIKELPKPIKEEPIKELPKPIKELPKPIKELPKPIKELPKPIKELPKPIKELPKPIKELPKPIKELPKPSDYMFIDEDKPEMVKSAFKKTQKRFKINTTHIHSPVDEMNSKKNVIENLLKENLKSMKSFKFNYGLEIIFSQISKEDQIKIFDIKEILWSSPQIILNENDIAKKIDLVISDIMHKMTSFSASGASSLVISKINTQYIDILQYKPLKGSSYIKLPKALKNPKMGLINIKNEDQKCFAYCLIYHLNQSEIKNNPQRVSVYKKYENTVDFTGIEFPVSIKDIPKIEKLNNISINVFGYETNSTFPIFISESQADNTLNLLLISKEEKRHYVYIKDFNRFMYNKTKHNCKKHFCIHCLQCFNTEEILKNHLENCLIVNKKQTIVMPKKGSKIYFKNYYKMLKNPFVIYCDFESILEPIETVKQDADLTSYTTEYQNHLISSYAYKVVCQNDKYTKPIKYFRGEDATKDFLNNLLKESDEIEKILKTKFNEKMIITKKQQNEFYKAKICHICKEKLHKIDKVRDHCHVTGEYRGAAHNVCNLQYRISNKVPVIFHNLRGYDSHFIIQKLGEFGLDISVIPTNSEKYMSFTWGKKMVFIDSFQFMPSSLEKLASNLSKDKYIHLENEMGTENSHLLKQKGVYCYEYTDNWDKYNETKLPNKEKFYSSLNDTNVSDDDYKRALEIWDKFNCKNLGEYSDLYLKTDVCLLADVFENFRNTCLTYYQLDPTHYFSSPGLAWDAMLKMTNVQLDLITDIDMENMVQLGMRGGVSTINHRHEKANNKYMKNYEKDKEDSYIMYLDANNLYGWAMSQKLPTGKFKWGNEENFDLNNYKGDKGCIIECDLEYPENLHDKHNMYPLAPEKLLIENDMLSPYCTEILNEFKMQKNTCKKLIPNLMNKQKYVLHYKNLQLYLDLGMKLGKIHRLLEFKQKNWLKDYIDFNTQKRKNASNSFEKDFFKLMNNSVFGKTMENLRNRCSIKLVTTKDQLLKWGAKPTYKRSVIYNENLSAILRIKESLILNKPSYVGMCILDLSKTLMYDFHYNYTLKKYDYENVKLLFTDTDSLCYHIKTKDAFEDFFQDKQLFDNSDYDINNKFYFNENKKVIGKMKDECAGIPITEFCGLRSKMYSYLKENDNYCCKAKGIKKNVVKKEIKHKNYLEILQNKTINRYKMNTIRSKNHIINTCEVNKIGLSCYDDKRFILDDGITTLAYGHYKIKIQS